DASDLRRLLAGHRRERDERALPLQSHRLLVHAARRHHQPVALAQQLGVVGRGHGRQGTLSTIVGEQAAVARGRALASSAGTLLPVRVVAKFVSHNGGSQAVLIAWNALAALFPIALAVAAIGGFVLSVVGVTPDAIARQVVALF